MGGEWIRVEGTLLRGHGVAGGSAPDSPHPEGTIALQAPFFAERGLELSGYHLATLNISTAPWVVRIQSPAFYFADVPWTPLHGPESFDIIDVRVDTGHRRVHGWGYRPTAETKADHPQPPDVLEVIAPFLPEVHDLKGLILELDPGQVVLERPTELPGGGCHEG
jgi:hypothetical protein